MQLYASGLDLGDVEDVVDKVEQMQTRAVNIVDVEPVAIIAKRPEQLGQDGIGKADDGIEGACAPRGSYWQEKRTWPELTASVRAWVSRKVSSACLRAVISVTKAKAPTRRPVPSSMAVAWNSVMTTRPHL
ncbi:MAG: hypothetical protein FD153_380 [Rhodospirillaceae bacterium]|nr:MAG: hypothetical protein FD153_380 [Rhodospirillaceae bacterium]